VEVSGCNLFPLVGEAGVGKSRLAGELLTGIGDSARVLRGRCLHYGEGITFWPLVEALMPVGESAEAVIERLNTGGAAVPEELFWEVRRVLEELAAERPVAVHLDDLQWAQPMLLDLLDHVVDLSRGAPILVLCTARPELLEERPGWGGGKLNASAMLLEPLSSEDSLALLNELGDGLDPDARARVIEGSEGNPLFLEEMAALARERGTVEVPPTIQALLTARLERLGADERELLERGAVEGEVFHRLAVKALAGERLAAEVELRLAGLVRKELIRPHPATFKNDDAFRFRHLLIRDAAYDTLPKATRADLHDRFAVWLQEHAAEMVELDEIAGWHLEQAVKYRRELGQTIDPDVVLTAGRHLAAAGRRAIARSDVAAASNLLERALALTPEEDPLFLSIAVELAEQHAHAGHFARAEELLAAAERDPSPLAILTGLDVMINTKPSEALQEIDAKLGQLLEQLTRSGDEHGIARAHLLAMEQHLMAAQSRAAAQEARLTALHAARAGDEGLKARALGWYVTELIWGPFHVDTIAHELDEIQREPQGPYVDAFIDYGRGEIARLRGDFGASVKLTQDATAKLEGLGMRAMGAAGALHEALVGFSSGQLQSVVRALSRADSILSELGERSFRSTHQALLAWAYALLGDREAALAGCELAYELSAPEDIINFVIVPAARARVARFDGDPERAEELARSAVQVGETTDNTVICVFAQLELAQVLADLRRREDAAVEGRRTLELYESKGDKPGMARTRAFLEAL
jgi:tetratricopeptide (TPR) repeat protein